MGDFEILLLWNTAVVGEAWLLRRWWSQEALEHFVLAAIGLLLIPIDIVVECLESTVITTAATSVHITATFLVPSKGLSCKAYDNESKNGWHTVRYDRLEKVLHERIVGQRLSC